jgi:UDP-N-acetylmuramate dehydrogenase
MKIIDNVSLKKYSTMKLGGLGSYLCNVINREDIIEATAWAKVNNLPVIMIGKGSNIIWSDDGFKGLILINKIEGYKATITDQTYEIEVGAGEDWDNVVERSVQAGATGIECLSLIPGTAGATPVQNVGAYGQDISQTLIDLEAYDRSSEKFVTIANEQCGFGYRSSRFKTLDHDRFFISSIRLKLKIANPSPPFYQAIQNYLAENPSKSLTPTTIREIVVYIRTKKLPDPDVIANTGSFFANPIINDRSFEELIKSSPNMIYWKGGDDKYKISAAWLLEEAGFKGFHDQETGMSTWEKQPLVIVNEHAEKTADLIRFKQKIVDAVQQKFNIKLEQEPEMLP